MQILQLLLAGTVGAALVKLVDNVIQFLLNRAAKKSDRKADKADADKAQDCDIAERSQQVKTLLERVGRTEKGQQVILHDRIKFLARAYIAAGEVNFYDYNDLKEMHETYRELGGKNLVRPMDEVSKLKTIYK